MRKIANAIPSPSGLIWKGLFEAALLEGNTLTLSQRLQDAQDAIMDEVEKSFQTASQRDRQSFISALNSLHELRKICDAGRPGEKVGIRNLGDAA